MTAQVPVEALVAAARGGDADAFSLLMDRYRDIVFAYALAALRDRDEAEDVAQETFVRAYQSLDRLRWGRSWEGWLMQILRNACRDAHRRKRVRQAEPINPEWLESGPGPEALALSAERRRELAAAVLGLPENLRVPLLMRVESGRTYREIALALGVPESTVVGRLAAAMRILRRRFGVEGRP